MKMSYTASILCVSKSTKKLITCVLESFVGSPGRTPYNIIIFLFCVAKTFLNAEIYHDPVFEWTDFQIAGVISVTLLHLRLTQ
jgi:hypothetical protein